MPQDQAREVANLIATTDGIIFHLWQHGELVPSGRVMIAQAVGHVNLTAAEKFKHQNANATSRQD
jgi:hypothetical protein